MGTDKPQISILMAVYNPRLDWFAEQLASLNVQTYPNIKLYVRNDCSQNVPHETVKAYVEKYITAFPCEVARNEKNLGSNGTFELLTSYADGDLFAYCDQDDVWLPEKLTVLEELMEREGSALVCSDMYVIDGEGRRIADNIGKIHRHQVFHSGDDVVKKLLFHNFVTGCTMIARAELCRAAIPFCPYMVHDYYLALYCAEHGVLSVASENLINYRIHGGNQTVTMAGVEGKESYYRLRILDYLKRLEWLRENLNCSEETRCEIDKGLLWLEARKKNWLHKGGKMTIWKYRRFSPITSLYEIVANWLPENLFKLCIEAARKNRI